METELANEIFKQEEHARATHQRQLDSLRRAELQRNLSIAVETPGPPAAPEPTLPIPQQDLPEFTLFPPNSAAAVGWAQALPVADPGAVVELLQAAPQGLGGHPPNRQRPWRT